MGFSSAPESAVWRNSSIVELTGHPEVDCDCELLLSRLEALETSFVSFLCCFQQFFLSNNVKMADLPDSFLPFQWYVTMCVSAPVSVTNPETQALWLWNSHYGCVSSRCWPWRTRETEMHRAVWRAFYHPAVVLWTAAKIGDRLKQEEKSNRVWEESVLLDHRKRMHRRTE